MKMRERERVIGEAFEAEHMKAYTYTPLQFYTVDPLCTILSKNLHNLLQTLNRDLYSV